ncbi:MAG TPA: hypothetical protein VK824_02200, partial [Planctomycetota bacterium]|nr:hypothetical protein [Planctomycetota bacterium]
MPAADPSPGTALLIAAPGRDEDLADELERTLPRRPVAAVAPGLLRVELPMPMPAAVAPGLPFRDRLPTD